jgi:hypothetical protein
MWRQPTGIEYCRAYTPAREISSSVLNMIFFYFQLTRLRTHMQLHASQVPNFFFVSYEAHTSHSRVTHEFSIIMVYLLTIFLLALSKSSTSNGSNEVVQKRGWHPFKYN